MKNTLKILAVNLLFMAACVKPAEDPAPVTVQENYYITVYRTINTGGSEISVLINGVNAGTITSINPTIPPCSGAVNGWVRFAVKPGKHDVVATGKDGKTWSATPTISQPGCVTLSIDN